MPGSLGEQVCGKQWLSVTRLASRIVPAMDSRCRLLIFWKTNENKALVRSLHKNRAGLSSRAEAHLLKVEPKVRCDKSGYLEAESSDLLRFKFSLS